MERYQVPYNDFAPASDNLLIRMLPELLLPVPEEEKEDPVPTESYSFFGKKSVSSSGAGKMKGFSKGG